MNKSSTTRVLNTIRQKSAGAQFVEELLRETHGLNPGNVIDTVADFIKAGGEMDLSCSTCGRNERLSDAMLADRYKGTDKLKVVKLDCEKPKGCGSIALPILPR